MGATTRREVISFAIPSGQSAKIQNIVNFGGIEESDNPFNVKTNTASEALNVFIDEHNALATRPRCKDTLYTIKPTHYTTHIKSIFPLKNGYFLTHVVEEDVPAEEYTPITEPLVEIGPSESVTLDISEYSFDEVGHTYSLNFDFFNAVKYSVNPVVLFDGWYDTIDATTSIAYNEGVFTITNSDILSIAYNCEIENSWVIATREGLYIGDVLMPASVEIPENIYSIYEKENLIYLFCGDKFLVINTQYPYGLQEIDAYIPIVETMSVVDGEVIRVKNEDYNTLSNKHRKKLYSDFSEDISNAIGNGKVISNEYLKTDSIHLKEYVYFDNNAREFVKPISNGMLYGKGGPTIADQTLSTKFIKVTDDEYTEIGDFDGISPLGFDDTGDIVVLPNEDNTGIVIVNLELEETTTKVFTDVDYKISDGYSTSIADIGWTKNVVIRGDTVYCLVKHLTTNSQKILKFTKTYVGDVATYTETTLCEFNGQSVPYNQSYLCVSSDMSVIRVYSTYRKSMKYSESTVTFEDFNKLTTNSVIAYDQFADNYIIYNNKKLYVGTNNDNYITKDMPNVVRRLFVEESSIVYAAEDASSVGIGVYRLFRNTYSPFEIMPDSVLLIDSGVFVNDKVYSYLTIGDPPAQQVIYRARLEPSSDFLITIEYDNLIPNETIDFRHYSTFADKFVVYGNDNRYVYSTTNDITYFPKTNFDSLGDSSKITGMLKLSNDVLGIFKTNVFYLLTVSDSGEFIKTESKSNKGNVAEHSMTITPLTEYPISVYNDGIYVLQNLKNVQSSDKTMALISSRINTSFVPETKNEMKVLSLKNWAYFFILPKGDETITKCYVLDDRTMNWFYWELPYKTITVAIHNEKLRLATFEKLYELTTDESLNAYNPSLTEYLDDDVGPITWKWTSQMLNLGTINYLKQLLTTGFIVTDTDSTDKYTLDYKFVVFRKYVSETSPLTIKDNLNYVQSVTKRTYIPKFNFIKIELSNSLSELHNNKMRLVGLSFKFRLLEVTV